MNHFREYLSVNKEFGEPLLWLKESHSLLESSENTRYSVEVNFRTTPDEVLTAYAKVALGYVSAGLKQHNLHSKHVYTEKPIRILVSNRNWEDGEWVGVVSWNNDSKCFVVSKGFYNKDRRTVSIQSSEKCKGENAAEITKHVYNMMHDLKDKPDKHKETLKGVNLNSLKRGPKK